MTQTPLLSAAELDTLLQNPPAGGILVLDCSWDLADQAAGRAAYDAGHLPGAAFVSLDSDLSAVDDGSSGRHPLPEPDAFAARMAELGANDDTLIVAYDNGNSMFAARLWWMLGWVGHDRRAVLDGGSPAWAAAGLPLETAPAEPRTRGDFTVRTPLTRTVDYDFVLANIESGESILIDARNAERFRGENETLDPQAGHIPGARNRPFAENLDSRGMFKPAAELRADFLAVMGDRSPDAVVNQCGSGVSACHNLLAMEIAGFEGQALYPGSWSEWSRNPEAPVAAGPA